MNSFEVIRIRVYHKWRLHSVAQWNIWGFWINMSVPSLRRKYQLNASWKKRWWSHRVDYLWWTPLWTTPFDGTCFNHSWLIEVFIFFFCFIGSFAANKSWHKIRISATSHSVHGIRGRWLAYNILPLIHKLLYNFSIFQKQTIIPRPRTTIFRWAPNWKQPILLPTLQMLMVAHKRNANTPGRSWPSQHAAKLVEVEIFI